MKLGDWPAFESLGESSWKFHAERAVHGKVHGATSDYRWLAASSGFRNLDAAERLTRVGQPDSIIPFSAWVVTTLSDGPVCYAVRYLESKAEDAFGRRGFLERHIWQWSPPRGRAYNLAAAALALLTRAAQEAQAGVYDRGQGTRWQDSQFRVELEASMVEARADDLERVAEVGRQWISEQVSKESLTGFYESLLTRRGATAMLAGVKEPLTAEALATLLLVFGEGSHYDARSICGWMPTTFALDPESIKHWNGVVTSRSASRTTSPQPESQEALLASFMRNKRKTDPDIIELLEFVRSDRRRHQAPLHEFRMTPEEQGMVNKAALHLLRVTEHPPAYMNQADASVREAYRQDMRLKLGTFCAAVFVIDPQHQAEEIDIGNELETVLKDWSNGSALARKRLQELHRG